MPVEELQAFLAALLEHGRQGCQVVSALGKLLQFALEGGPDGAEEGVFIPCPVVAPGPLPLYRQHSRLGQNLQVPGDARLPHTHDAGQLLHGELTAQKNGRQTKAAGVSQGFE